MGERDRALLAERRRGRYVDVCPLCQDTALEYGWMKEGSPTTPDDARRAPAQPLLARHAPRRPRPPAEAPIASEPILRRLSEPELAIVEAADLFNASQYRRTVGGIAKSLGDAARLDHPALRASTRTSSSPSPGRSPGTSTASRPTPPSPCASPSAGTSPSELEGSFTEWNAHLEDDGRIVPDIARL